MKNAYHMKAEFVKALAHPIRLQILDLLMEKPMTVSEISQALKREHSGVSRHISVLKGEGVIGTKNKGVPAFYSITHESVQAIIECANSVLKERLEHELETLKTMK